VLNAIAQWWQRLAGDDRSPFDSDSSAFAVSFVSHLCVIVLLGLAPMAGKPPEVTLVVHSRPPEEVDELQLPEEFAFNDLPSEEVGASSVQGDAIALSMAPVVAEFTATPNQVIATPLEHARIEINDILEQARGLQYAENLAVKGAAGEGTTGAVGAIDRITHEILLSMEERRTLVVWLFDQTESLIPQRQAIRDRFGKIYDQLGIVEATANEAFTKHESKPLLSAVVGFGNSIKYMTEKPTDNTAELKKAVMNLPKDESGTENVFSAISDAAKRFATYRHTTPDKPNPERNVMIVVFTDEAGSDIPRAEETVKMCRRWAIPVYVIGVPAPFGRQEAFMKWVDPDPRFSQKPQRGVVEQGPETAFPERVRISFAGEREDEPPLDSGFGPYALTRLCSETGGIYFAVHPNRSSSQFVRWDDIAPYSSHLSRFFDPEVMRRYRPEYVSFNDYQKRINENKARTALIKAATASNQVDAMEDPKRVFVKRDEAEFSRELSEAQQKAALLEPKINALYQILQQGEGDRDKETVARWQAGFDLAMGRTLAVKIRTEAYNAMLAAAKRGLKVSNPKNNTFEILAADEISVGSNYAKLAERAKFYLNRVLKEHAGTPWAAEARRELENPLGWKWKDSYTDLTPKPQPKPAANNNNNAKPAPEQKMMLPPPPVRPVPKKL
jgi:von Willebrand factor type A domain-containing protein